jgi:hypothetical protein
MAISLPALPLRYRRQKVISHQSEKGNPTNNKTERKPNLMHKKEPTATHLIECSPPSLPSTTRTETKPLLTSAHSDFWNHTDPSIDVTAHPHHVVTRSSIESCARLMRTGELFGVLQTVTSDGDGDGDGDGQPPLHVLRCGASAAVPACSCK